MISDDRLRYRTIHTILVVTLLVHKIAMSLGTKLKAKLAAYRPSSFIGVEHMFAVTLSRLSYVDVLPDAIKSQDRRMMGTVGGKCILCMCYSV